MHEFGLVALGTALAFAVHSDIRGRTISNVLVAIAWTTGIALAAIGWGPGPGSALLGSLLASVAFLPLYLMRGMAAGDVKLMGVVGVYLGVPGAIPAALYSAIAGGVLAIVWKYRQGPRGQMPYAIAIAGGSMAYVLSVFSV